MKNYTETEQNKIKLTNQNPLLWWLLKAHDSWDIDQREKKRSRSIRCMINLLQMIFFLSSATFIHGCYSAKPKAFAENQSYSITAISVTRWDDYKSSLQPVFNLKAEEALSKAMPTTSRVEDSMLDAFRASIKAKVAPSSALQAGFGKPEETFAGANMPAGWADSDSSLSGAPQGISSGNAGIDNYPFLTYLAGTALYQEVQLLNRYITDANLADNYRPYVVQFMVNQDFAGPPQGFDTDIIMSFFDNVYESSKEGGRLSYGESPDYMTEEKMASEERAKLAESPNLPLVLPMLVTDQVESSLRSSRAEELQQYALAVAAGYAGLGGAIDLEDVSRKIRSALRADLNHRFSVSRVNNNTVRVHLGARQVPKANKNEYQYVADEGNHRVTLVILVPDKWVEKHPKEIRFIAKAHITNAETGERFDTPGNWTVDRALDNLGKGGHPLFNAELMKELRIISDIDNYKEKLGISIERVEFLSALESDVRNNNYEEFNRKIDSKYDALVERKSRQRYDEIKNSLWHEMSGLSIGSRYAAGSFWASTYLGLNPSFGQGDTNVLALDDGKTTTIIIPGVKDLDPDRVRGHWVMKTIDAPNKPFRLDSKSARLEGQTELNMTFSSLKQLGLHKPDGGSTVNLSLEMTDIKRGGISVVYVPTVGGKLDGVEVKTPISKLPIADKVKLPIAIIATKDSPLSIIGSEEQRLPNDKNLDGFYQIEILGGRVDKLPPFLHVPTLKKPFSYPIVGTGVGDIELSGLAPDSKVSLSITPAVGFADEKMLEIPVATQKTGP